MISSIKAKTLKFLQYDAKKHMFKQIFIAISIIFIVAVMVFIYYLTSNQILLKNKLNTLESQLASSTNDLHVKIDDNYSKLANDIRAQKENVGTIEQKLGEYKEEVGDFTGAVENLEKLSKTDPELLQKYSKVFFLNENYAPARLVEIPNEYKYSDSKILKFSDPAWPYLQRMLDAAAKADLKIYVHSAYRSFNEQQALKGQYSVIYGAGSANTFSADQGYSEHQLGTTIDLITSGLGGSLDGFDNTKAYTWLVANAYKYGFILSYPKNNSFYVFEPWHWRFVGTRLARHLHSENINFYDMDQRDIDEYLVNIFD